MIILKKTTLIADDSGFMKHMIRDLLIQMNFGQIEEVSDGAEAEKKYKSGRQDIAF